MATGDRRELFGSSNGAGTGDALRCALSRLIPTAFVSTADISVVSAKLFGSFRLGAEPLLLAVAAAEIVRQSDNIIPQFAAPELRLSERRRFQPDQFALEKLSGLGSWDQHVLTDLRVAPGTLDEPQRKLFGQWRRTARPL